MENVTLPDIYQPESPEDTLARLVTLVNQDVDPLLGMPIKVLTDKDIPDEHVGRHRYTPPETPSGSHPLNTVFADDYDTLTRVLGGLHRLDAGNDPGEYRVRIFTGGPGREPQIDRSYLKPRAVGIAPSRAVARVVAPEITVAVPVRGRPTEQQVDASVTTYGDGVPILSDNELSARMKAFMALDKKSEAAMNELDREDGYVGRRRHESRVSRWILRLGAISMGSAIAYSAMEAFAMHTAR
jgi:hypothetical protein